MLVYKGGEGCAILSMNTVLRTLNDWAGAIYMVSGLVLVFAGGFFIQATLSFIIFLLVSGALFILFFTFDFMYESMLEGSTMTIAIVVIACIIAGVIATFLI